jgi:hypothetical protein
MTRNTRLVRLDGRAGCALLFYIVVLQVGKCLIDCVL